MAELPDGLPGMIKIGYMDFTLESWDARAANSARRYGECSHIEQTIRVEFCHGRKSANTLIHEIMHAVAAMQNVEDGATEEQFVTSVANGLSTVWRDNPDVFAWIGKTLADG